MTNSAVLFVTVDKLTNPCCSHQNYEKYQLRQHARHRWYKYQREDQLLV